MEYLCTICATQSIQSTQIHKDCLDPTAVISLNRQHDPPHQRLFAPLSTHETHDPQIHKHVLIGCSNITRLQEITVQTR